MKAKTFLILWLLGFLLIAPKWIPATAPVAKVQSLLHSRAGEIQVGTTLGFFSVR